MNIPLNIFKTFQNISRIDNLGRFQGESNMWATNHVILVVSNTLGAEREFVSEAFYKVYPNGLAYTGPLALLNSMIELSCNVAMSEV